MHLHIKLKKIQMEEERLATIERDNRMLLEKMSKIMRTSGSVDNKNEYEHKSINRRSRQYELLRITQENQAILKRIQARKPDIDCEAMAADYSKSQTLTKMITHYPKEPLPGIAGETRRLSDLEEPAAEGAAEGGAEGAAEGAAEAPLAATSTEA